MKWDYRSGKTEFVDSDDPEVVIIVVTWADDEFLGFGRCDSAFVGAQAADWDVFLADIWDAAATVGLEGKKLILEFGPNERYPLADTPPNPRDHLSEPIKPILGIKVH